jgi:hypothetical protein
MRRAIVMAAGITVLAFFVAMLVCNLVFSLSDIMPLGTPTAILVALLLGYVTFRRESRIERETRPPD